MPAGYPRALYATTRTRSSRLERPHAPQGAQRGGERGLGLPVVREARPVPRRPAANRFVPCGEPIVVLRLGLRPIAAGGGALGHPPQGHRPRNRTLEKVEGGAAAPRHIAQQCAPGRLREDRKSTRLNSSHSQISYAVFCLKKK